MFKPYIGKCTGTDSDKGCGRTGQKIATKRLLCPYCEGDRRRKEGKQAAYLTKSKPSKKIAENNAYYRKAIANNIERNEGVCRCDECNSMIYAPTGRNVAHIIGAGANLALYHDEENHFILGKGSMFGECNCLWKFDESGEKHEMKLYDRYVEIKGKLNIKYYKK